MPFVIALIGIVVGAYFWMQRARTAADAARELTGVAQDVMSAARRFGFRRKANVHPVEALEDPDVAIAAAGIAFLELGGLPTSEQHDRLLTSLQSRLGQSVSRAEEALILGRWLVGECGGPQPGLSRMARRLYKLRGVNSFQPLMAVLKDVAAAGRDGAVSPRQSDALTEIASLYRIN